MLLAENEVTAKIEKELTKRGFKIVKVSYGRKKGVDIQCVKDGVTYYFENEGNKKPNGNPLNHRQKYTHLLRCIGQICLRMQNEGRYFIGLPVDEDYKKYTEQLHKALEKLNVKIVWVDTDVYLPF